MSNDVKDREILTFLEPKGLHIERFNTKYRTNATAYRTPLECDHNRLGARTSLSRIDVVSLYSEEQSQ
jgi:hypothetical protein